MVSPQETDVLTNTALGIAAEILLILGWWAGKDCSVKPDPCAAWGTPDYNCTAFSEAFSVDK